MTRDEIDYWLDLLVSEKHERWYFRVYVPVRSTQSAQSYYCNVCDEDTANIDEHYQQHEPIARTMRDQDLYPFTVSRYVSMSDLSIFLHQLVAFGVKSSKLGACAPRAYAIISDDLRLSSGDRTRAFERLVADPGFGDAVKAAAEINEVARLVRQQVGGGSDEL